MHRFFRSNKYIKWYMHEATPEQRRIIRNIRSRQRFTRWAIARNHWWGWTKDALIASLLVFGSIELICYLIYRIGKVIWWH